MLLRQSVLALRFLPGEAGTGQAQPDWPPKVTGLRQQTDYFLPSALRL